MPMKNQDKTKGQLIDELGELRKRNAELEESRNKHTKAEEALHKLNAELDERVRERTEKLRTQIEEAGMTPVADDPLGKHISQ